MTTVPGWPDYRKSSRSSTDSSCVAVNRTGTEVRDTKNMSAGALTFTNLHESLNVIKTGRFGKR